MITRLLQPKLTEALAHSPAVALLDPRQVGKTALALEVSKSFPGRLWGSKYHDI